MFFDPGQIVATRNALHALDAAAVDPATLLHRHICGDWGELGQEDLDANRNALSRGGRLLSKYTVAGETFYCITEHDRSYTTLMLRSDY